MREDTCRRTLRARWSVVLGVSALLACAKADVPQSPDVRPKASLAKHGEQFKKEVIRVTDGLYVAVGFGLANSILIEGDDGLVVVDTMETMEEAEAVKAEFRKISDKPIKAIIYTHNHTDHVFGSVVFAEGRPVDVYAHETTSEYLDRVAGVLRPIIAVRSARMFGTHLKGRALENAGIGPALHLRDGSHVEALRPTKTVHDKLEAQIAGIKLELVHAPGETNDQLFVWLPEKRALLPGDNIYRAFPNLYSIRGTPYRDVTQWVRSLDEMRRRRPAHLVPSHTRPLHGEENIYRILTDYRDAIQFVHDQTILGINRGLTPEQLVAFVRLPPHLARSPFLQEYYGTVRWSVRSIYTGYLGWFNGNPSALEPLEPKQRAQNLSDLLGGLDKLVAAAKRAAGDGDHQWALELTDHILKLDPIHAEGRKIRTVALTALGQAQSNPNARHYYLTSALEIQKGLKPGSRPVPTEAMVLSVPLEVFFAALATRLDAQKTLQVQKKVNFVFPDKGQTYSMHIRRGVAEIQSNPLPEPDITITVDSGIWKRILVGARNPAMAFAQGEIKLEGGAVELLKFLGYFDRDDVLGGF